MRGNIVDIQKINVPEVYEDPDVDNDNDIEQNKTNSEITQKIKMRGQIASVNDKEININENMKSKIQMRGNIVDIINVSEEIYEDHDADNNTMNETSQNKHIKDSNKELNTKMKSKIKMRGNIVSTRVQSNDIMKVNVSEEIYPDSDSDDNKDDIHMNKNDIKEVNNNIKMGSSIGNDNNEQIIYEDCDVDDQKRSDINDKIKMRSNSVSNRKQPKINVSDNNDEKNGIEMRSSLVSNNNDDKRSRMNRNNNSRSLMNTNIKQIKYEDPDADNNENNEEKKKYTKDQKKKKNSNITRLKNRQ
eukprot:387031_1